MSRARRIESTANPKVKEWVALHRRRDRDRHNRFLIEGAREISRAAAGGITINAVITGDAATPSELALADATTTGGATRYELADAPLGRISFRRHPAGIVAEATTPDFSLERIELPAAPLVLVVDALEKPGNIGAILRSADGAGVDAVVVADAPGDLVNPNTIRASQGALFTIPIAAAAAPAAAEWLTQQGIRTVAATGDASRLLWEADLTGAVAIVIGSEHAGLSTGWRRTPAVAIPMAGESDSLNASVAAAVLLYEAVRQRRPGRPV